jgi:hypothetical protein
LFLRMVNCLTTFTFFAVRMVATTPDMPKTWKNALKCIAGGEGLDTPEYTNLKSWSMSRNLTAAGKLLEESGESKLLATTKNNI